MLNRLIFAAFTSAALMLGCTSHPTAPSDKLPPDPPPTTATPPTEVPPEPPTTPPPTTPTPPPSPGELPPVVHTRDHIWVGAGDIAFGSDPMYETARLVEGIDGTVFTTGDNVYMNGTADEFRRLYEPSWGRFKSRTRPSPGNHDYGTPGAVDYFNYFGAQAGPFGRGYYSYNLGSWHIISLNSEDLSGQMEWLRQDLAAHQQYKCTAAYWHKPVTSSGQNGDNPHMLPTWAALADAGVDLVVNGHDHLYERFGGRNSRLAPDDISGMRQFTVGTGGAPIYRVVRTTPSSERVITAYGVIRFVLGDQHYRWEFHETSRQISDQGFQLCH